MPTILEEVDRFYKICPPGFYFSRKNIKVISRTCKSIYDSKKFNPPITYKLQLEHKGEIQVRDYPDNFRPIIQEVLRKAYNHAKSNGRLKRKRIPAKPQKIKSFKPSSKL